MTENAPNQTPPAYSPVGGGGRRWTQLAAELPKRRSSNEIDERPSSAGTNSADTKRESNSAKRYQASELEALRKKQEKNKRKNEDHNNQNENNNDNPNNIHDNNRRNEEEADELKVPPPTLDQIQSLAPPSLPNKTKTKTKTTVVEKNGHRRMYTSELIVGWRSVSNASAAAMEDDVKEVVFSHRTTVDYVGFTYSEEEKKKCWYTRKELNRSLAKELKQLIKQMNDPFYKDDDDRPDATCSNRGIEHMTSPSLLRTLQKNKARVCRSVHKEQNRQDRLGMFCDESIAQASLKYSRRASDLAAFRGEADAMAVRAMERNRRACTGSLHRRLRSDSLAEAALDLAVLPVVTPVANVQEASVALGVQDASALPELTEGEVVETALPDNMELAAAPPTVETVVPAAVAETSTSLVEALDLPMEDIVTDPAVAVVADLPDRPADPAAAAAEALEAAEALAEQDQPSSPLPAVIIDGNLADEMQESNGEVIINYEQLGVAIPQEIQQAAPVVALGDTPEDLSLASPIFSIQTI